MGYLPMEDSNNAGVLMPTDNKLSYEELEQFYIRVMRLVRQSTAQQIARTHGGMLAGIPKIQYGCARQIDQIRQDIFGGESTYNIIMEERTGPNEV